ncbi:MAG: carbamoyltransferase HypF [Methanobrevibacter sp.]|uniref:carbamoyltransferase HypF n=1 Tax=Methanobrevibacter sp. TaxID=66852 RepID=UPI0026E104A2|nr:carbamoyltransferase HypF [Methanobrevibacter sp.]MDO5848044.1 carbamoyltransferase HypF [Methanobrevibacter sp.]
MASQKLLVEGIVQGVGFRPFVYRLAKDMGINGNVRNLGNIVEINIDSNFDQFKERLVNELPPIASINSIKSEEIPDQNFSDFTILESDDYSDGVSVIPPDVSICDKCLEEIRDPNNRRYKYPFNACTDCGPRFTVIDSVPYDRINTSMNEFPLCDDCLEEYKEPMDRRYHGEAICCEECGPEMMLYSNSKLVNTDDPIKEAAKQLGKGKIIAIKGIGGTHLVVDAYNKKAIQTLRDRLNRPNQAFAVMSKDLETVEDYTILSENEKKTLKSRERPIVVVKANKDYPFPENLTGGLHTIGVMLPYSPMHYLLFDESESDTLVMTSANIPGEPMMIDSDEIINLEIADYSLVHNREILNRCDDSVVRFRNDELSFIRRSRGYTPTPVEISDNYDINDYDVLSLGPELDVTFSIATKNLVYPSQHIGNTNKFKTLEFLKTAITHLENILKINDYDVIACDLHPNFFTTKLAKEYSDKYDAQLLQVQHHYAHAVSLMNDNKCPEAVVIAADGVGYGDDNTSWGGEILYSNVESYKRLASLEAHKMPGGDQATKYPARMLASILSTQYSNEELERILKENYSHLFKYGEKEVEMVLKQIDANLNVGLSSSTGRVLDSVAVALDICGERTYEGECSMKLESAAYKSSNPIAIDFEIKDNKLITSKILKDVVENYINGENKKDIAAGAQIAVAKGLSELAIENAGNVDTIGATGGVFYNESISKTCKEYITKNGFNFIQHKNSCSGDGSVSVGQAIVAKVKK